MSDISTKHTQLGGNAGLLGEPAGAETTCPDGNGRFRHYAHGSIYWHPATGAHEVHGSIRAKWESLGWELSWLGYPTTDETDVPGGKRSAFEHGRIDWSGAAGAVDSDGVDSVTYTSTSGDGPARSKREIAAMLMTKAAEFVPDERKEYANSGYLLLAAVIEHVTGNPWFNVLRANVLNPLGLTRPRPSGSLLSQRVEGEALYHDWGLTLVRSVMTAAQPLVRVAYGNPNLAVGDAVGGMAFSGADLVKLYAALQPGVSTPVLSRTTIEAFMWGTMKEGWMTGSLRGGGHWFGHNGGLENMQSFASARSDDIVYALAFNKEMNGFEPPPLWDDLLDDVESYPSHDLFPSVGITPFA